MNPTEEPVLATPHSWDRETVSREAGPLRLPGVIVWLALVWLAWFEVGRQTLGATLGDAASPRAVVFAAIAGVAGRIVGELIEAGFYVTLWRALGRTLPFTAFFVAIVSLSILDLVSLQVVHTAGDPPTAWLAILCGFQVLPGVLAGEPGLRVAFGGVGLFSLVRVAATARAQKAAGGRWTTAAVLTVAVWLAGRLATWWVTDLVRGMSPLP